MVLCIGGRYDGPKDRGKCVRKLRNDQRSHGRTLQRDIYDGIQLQLYTLYYGRYLCDIWAVSDQRFDHKMV